MKKFLVPAIVLGLVAAAILVRSAIVAPARAAARDLEAINGLTVGQTTEAELLGRSAFQKIDRQCFEADCVYHTQRTNHFLNALHLAPYTFFGTGVSVRDGMVNQVSVFMSKDGLTPISISQKITMPAGCQSNPCVKRAVLPSKQVVSIMVVFDDQSQLRNRMPEVLQASCLSRLQGCQTYDEVMPLAKEVNLSADK